MNQLLFAFDTSTLNFIAFNQIKTNAHNILHSINKYILNSNEKTLTTLTKLYTSAATTQIGTILFNDYSGSDYIIKKFPFTNYIPDITSFLWSINFDSHKLTEKGAQRPIETVFKNANTKYQWLENEKSISNIQIGPLHTKLLIIVSSGCPYDKEFTLPAIDWRQEIKKLKDKEIKLGFLQLTRPGNKFDKGTDNFYKEVIDLYGVSHCRLNSIKYLSEALIGLTLHTFRHDLLSEYISNLSSSKLFTSELSNIFIGILNKKFGDVPPIKFNVLNVFFDCLLKDMYKASGLTHLRSEHSYYELTKTTKILPAQSIISENKDTGEILDNSRTRATYNLNVDALGTVINPAKFNNTRFYLQCTTTGQKLKKGTYLLIDN